MTDDNMGSLNSREQAKGPSNCQLLLNTIGKSLASNCRSENETGGRILGAGDSVHFADSTDVVMTNAPGDGDTNMENSLQSSPFKTNKEEASASKKPSGELKSKSISQKTAVQGSSSGMGCSQKRFPSSKAKLASSKCLQDRKHSEGSSKTKFANSDKKSSASSKSTSRTPAKGKAVTGKTKAQPKKGKAEEAEKESPTEDDEGVDEQGRTKDERDHDPVYVESPRIYWYRKRKEFAQMIHDLIEKHVELLPEEMKQDFIDKLNLANTMYIKATTDTGKPWKLRTIHATGADEMEILCKMKKLPAATWNRRYENEEVRITDLVKKPDDKWRVEAMSEAERAQHMINKSRRTEEEIHSWMSQPSVKIGEGFVEGLLVRSSDKASQGQIYNIKDGFLSRSSLYPLGTRYHRTRAIIRHSSWRNREKTPFISFTSDFSEVIGGRLAHFEARQIKAGYTLHTKITLLNAFARKAKGLPILRVKHEQEYYNLGKTPYFQENEYLIPFRAGPDEIIGTWCLEHITGSAFVNNCTQMKALAWWKSVAVPAFQEHETARREGRRIDMKGCTCGWRWSNDHDKGVEAAGEVSTLDEVIATDE